MNRVLHRSMVGMRSGVGSDVSKQMSNFFTIAIVLAVPAIIGAALLLSPVSRGWHIAGAIIGLVPIVAVLTAPLGSIYYLAMVIGDIERA